MQFLKTFCLKILDQRAFQTGTFSKENGKHHTEDYKLSAVKYALRTGNQVETCEVFDCKRQSLQDWLRLYEATGKVIPASQTRRTSYKITQAHLDFLRAELRKKPEIFMEDLKHMLEEKVPGLSVSREHIAKVLRDNNKTRKRLRKIHQPSTYRGKTRDRTSFSGVLGTLWTGRR